MLLFWDRHHWMIIVYTMTSVSVCWHLGKLLKWHIKRKKTPTKASVLTLINKEPVHFANMLHCIKNPHVVCNRVVAYTYKTAMQTMNFSTHLMLQPYRLEAARLCCQRHQHSPPSSSWSSSACLPMNASIALLIRSGRGLTTMLQFSLLTNRKIKPLFKLAHWSEKF